MSNTIPSELERALVAAFSHGLRIGLASRDDVRQSIAITPPATAPGSLVAAKRQAELVAVTTALTEAKWNVSLAASRLEIERTNLHKKMKALGISRPGTRRPTP